MGDGKGFVDTGVLTQEMLEAAATNAVANHGKPTQILWPHGNGKFYMWNASFETKWTNTPYENFVFMEKNLQHFANMHLLLFKLKVSKFSPKENYEYITSDGADRIKKIRPKPTEKTLRRIKRRDKRRQEDEKLPYYKRSVSWNTRGRI